MRRPIPRPRPMSVLLVALAAILAGCGGADQDAGPTTDPTADQTADPNADTAPTDESTDNLELDDLGNTPELAFDPSLTVVVANSDSTISTSGSQRVMTALIGDGPNSFFGGPDDPVTIRYESVEGDTVGEVEGAWLTTNASALGLYVSYYEFDAPGLWEITAFGDGENLGTTLIQVVEDSPVPNLGDPAPQSVTLTGTTAEEIAAISTDPEPNPSFYDLSISDAVANGRPTVVAFVTPAFCQTALCGPTLETVKAAVGGREDLDVVHVEPFDLDQAPRGVLEPIPTMGEWGLVTEPWVFVMNGDGIVTASFEGIIGQDELEAAVSGL